MSPEGTVIGFRESQSGLGREGGDIQFTVDERSQWNEQGIYSFFQNSIMIKWTNKVKVEGQRVYLLERIEITKDEDN